MTGSAQIDSVMNDHATASVAKLDEMRLLARDVAKHASRSGLPTELHWEIIKLIAVIETLEARVGEYAAAVIEA